MNKQPTVNSLASSKNVSIYSLNDFPALHYLHNHLIANYAQLHQYCTEMMHHKKLNPTKRKPGEWVGKSADEFVNKVGDSWMLGWTSSDTLTQQNPSQQNPSQQNPSQQNLYPNNETNWLNYLVIYKGEIRSNHSLVELLFGEIKDIVNVCGLSLLTPKAIIPPHVDEDTTITKNRLTYHFNVFGNGSTIIINNTAYCQTPGTSIVFDSGFTHSVINGNDSRLLIYIDFNVEMSKKYIYGKVINIDNNKMILETYNTICPNDEKCISHLGNDEKCISHLGNDDASFLHGGDMQINTKCLCESGFCHAKTLTAYHPKYGDGIIHFEKNRAIVKFDTNFINTNIVDTYILLKISD
ncbi:hypothetical protein QJ857_gp0246 [Tupanvirus soda lake]|uniref:Aspartyl/asparaginy/proline hydroxylase domain-containing protein n=2 Tax=Tupanvirus TaxID=2094720 RepID=A0A6N1NN33_9VIRU|nr:hypothetical protein QJ857_gp0246 [Tupanvirus soda lake]QKU35779.1 hypothetical protein [Tupanvirus soda lake]